MAVFDLTIKEVLNERLLALEKHFDGDVIFYYGDINPGYLKVFRDFIESLRADPPLRDRLIIVLNTPGGQR